MLLKKKVLKQNWLPNRKFKNECIHIPLGLFRYTKQQESINFS